MSNQLNILIVGDRGSGKSTAARVVTKALRDAGFAVELSDKDDVSEEQFHLRLEALRGTGVRVTCGNVHIKERGGAGHHLGKDKPCGISPIERAKGKSEGYWQMSPSDQWAEDKRNGILDWEN